MKNIIMLECAIETVNYFNSQMRSYFEDKGYNVICRNWESLERDEIKRICSLGNTGILCYNFQGIAGKDRMSDKEGHPALRDLDIPIYNYVVDHPYYYADRFGTETEKMTYLAVDRNHEKYVERFMSHYRQHAFFPLAGTEYIRRAEQLKMKDRPIDVLFAGNYVNPDYMNLYFERDHGRFSEIYHNMIDLLWSDSSRTLESVMEEVMRREQPMLSDVELAELMNPQFFLDVYMRNELRRRLLVELSRGDFMIDIYGSGWEELDGVNWSNIRLHGGVDSVGVLKKMSEAKITLNVLPWFRDGAHDRIFNAMLQGSVSVSDESIYLKEIATSGRELLFYSRDDGKELTDRIEQYLSRPEELSWVSENGYTMAKAGHTWKHRAELLEKIML